MMKFSFKRIMSFALALVMLFTLMPQLDLLADAAAVTNHAVNGLAIDVTNTGSKGSCTGSASGNKLTVTAKGGRSWGSSYAASGNVTFTNTCSNLATLSFVCSISSNPGSITVNGTSVTATSTPFTFDIPAGESVVINVKSASNATTTAVFENISLTATVTFAAAENGSYTVQGGTLTNATTAPTSSTDACGTGYTLLATPADGYILDGWYQNGVKISGTNKFSLEYPYPNQGTCTIAPKFIEYKDITVEFALPQGGGSYTAADSEGAAITVGSAFTALSGTFFTVKATPAEGFVFDGWQCSKDAAGTYVSTSAEYTFANSDLSTENYSIYPVFRLVNKFGFTLIYDSNLGSVSTAGLSADGKGCFAETPVTLTASAKSGTTFLGWTDVNGKSLSKEATYSFTPTGTVTIRAIFARNANNATSADVFKVGDYVFSDLNDADVYASSQSSKLIILLSNATLPAGNYTVSSGNTLLIPRDTKNSAHRDSPELYETDDILEPTAFRTLTMAPGANLTIYGTMEVEGMHKTLQGSKAYSGSVWGPYGAVKMESGSKITVADAATLYAWGYIYGHGAVEALSGAKVYEFIQVADFAGGSNLSAFVDTSPSSDTNGNGIKNDDHIKAFPFSQYYIQNIEVSLTLHAGAKEYVYAAMTMTAPIVGAISVDTPIEFIGSSGLFNVTSGKITKTYDPATDRTIFDLEGNVHLQNLVIDMSDHYLSWALELVIKTNRISSADFILSLNGNMTINVLSGTTTIGQNITLLPGLEMNIAKEARVVLATANDSNDRFNADDGNKGGYNVYIFGVEDWLTGANGAGYIFQNQQMISAHYSPSQGRYKRTVNDLKDVKIDVNGTIECYGFLYTTPGAAEIISSQGTGRIDLINGAGSATKAYILATESAGSGTQVEATFTVEPAFLYNHLKDENKNHSKAEAYDFTSTAGAAANTTYYFNKTCNMWVANVSSGHTPDAAATCTTPATCIICGVEVVGPLGHSFTSYVSNNNATCTTDATETAKCDRCDVTDTRPIAGTALNHSFTNYISNNNATCTTDATEKAKCDRCDVTDTRPITGTARGHGAINGFTYTPNGEGNATHEKKCNDCSAVIEPAAAHDFSTGPCTCGVYKVTLIENLFNGQTYAPFATTVIYIIPTVNGDLLNFVFTLPNCHFVNIDETMGNYEKGVAVGVGGYLGLDFFDGSQNGAVLTVSIHATKATGPITIDLLTKLTHTEQTTTVDEVPATCGQPGSYTELVSCSVCGAEIRRTEGKVIPATGNHSYDSVVTPPSCTADGYTTHTCTGCGDVKVDSTVPSSGHAESAPKEENKQDATCEADGSYDSVVYCATCGTELSRETIPIPHTGHNYNAVVTPPSCTADGYTTHTCSVCGNSYVDTYVDALGHDWQTSYTYKDDAQHTKTEDCANCDAVTTEDLDHNFDAGPCACGLCKIVWMVEGAEPHTDYVMKGAPIVAPTAPAKPGYFFVRWQGREDAGWTAESNAIFDAVYYKLLVQAPQDSYEFLSAQFDEENGLVIQLKLLNCHVISEVEIRIANQLSTGTTQTAEGIVTITIPADQVLGGVQVTLTTTQCHSYQSVTTQDATCAQPGLSTITCSVCGHSYTEPIPATGEHDYSVEVEGSRVPATCVKTGSVTMKCSACDATKDETLAIDPENHSKVVTDKAQAPTCTVPGKTEGSHCEGCNATIVAQQDVPASGHTPGTAVKERVNPATCTQPGSYDEVVYCQICGIEVSRQTIPTDPLGHGTKDGFTYEPNSDGLTHKVTCKDCGETIDASAEHEYVNGECVCEAKQSLTITWIVGGQQNSASYTYGAAFPVPTEPQDGNKLFLGWKNADGNLMTAWPATVTESAEFTAVFATCFPSGVSRNVTMESYIEGEFLVIKLVAPCTLINANEDISAKDGQNLLSCVTDISTPGTYLVKLSTEALPTNIAVYLELADVADAEHAWNDGVETVAPGCETEGEMTYTCSTCGSTKKESIEVTNHNWVLTKYVWSDDGKTCVAHAECQNANCEETTTAEGTITSAVKTGATCTEMGWTTYTAEFTADWATTQAKDVQDIAALNHAWSVSYSWSADGKSCTATRTCGNDADHNMTETITGTPTVKTPATCTEKGWNTYTVTFTADWVPVEYKVRTNDVQDIEALDHAWTVSYTWSDDGKSCTATRACGNDAAHNQTETITGTPTEKTPATCTEKGWNTYTVTFTADWVPEEDKVRTNDVQDIPATDHRWVLTEYVWSDDGKTCTAHAECQNGNCNETTTANGVVTSAEKTPATCTVKGWTTYTATFANVDWAESATKDVQDIPEAAHTPGTPKIENPVTADCVNDGSYDKVTYCTECSGEISREHVVITALNHQDNNNDYICDRCWEFLCVDHVEEDVTGYAATCTKTGLTDGVKCKNCGQWITPQEVIPVLDHVDTDKNHICDRNCGKSDMNWDQHKDSATDDNHLCDYGCDASLESCTWLYDDNANGTHKVHCKICDAVSEQAQAHHYGTTGICICGNTAEAKIGAQFYCTLREAVEAAAAGKTVSLCKDVVLTEKLNVNGTQTWDFGSWTLTVANVDDNYGLVVAGDLTIVSGKYVVTGIYGIGVGPSGKLTIRDGNFTFQGNNDYLIGNFGSLQIYGGTFHGQYNCVNNFEGTTVIYGGSYSTEKLDFTGEYESTTLLADFGLTVFGGEFSNDETVFCDDTHHTIFDAEKDKFVYGSCVDEDKDHDCDLGCGREDMNWDLHKDSATDGDHVCDYGCGAALEECSDKSPDGNHDCDICGKKDVTEHTYADATCEAPRTCTDCSATDGQPLDHIDENTDHICDRNCGKSDMNWDQHKDSATDRDHVCDYGCGDVLEGCSDSKEDTDHDCDICGKKDVTEHEYGAWQTDGQNHWKVCNCDDISELGAHTDEATPDHKCDTCEYVMSVCGDGNDKDHLCDICNGSVGEECYGGTATCTDQAICAECEQPYGELDETKHASEAFEYVANGDNTHIKRHACCDDAIDSAEACTFTDHICDHCDATEKFTVKVYQADGTTLIGSLDIAFGDAQALAAFLAACREEANAPTAPNACTSYTFGWNQEIPDTMPGEDLSFTAVFTPVINHTDNRYTYSDNGDGTHNVYHRCCGMFKEAQNHEDGADTNHNCDLCSAKDIEGHTPGEEIQEGRNPANCGVNGSYESVYKCTECGSEISRTTVTIPATGAHSYVAGQYTWSDAHDACSVVGTCSVCQQTVTATATVTPVQTQTPTCVANGITTYKATFAESWATPQTVQKDDVPPTGIHTYQFVNATWTITEESATCTANGKCTGCDDTTSVTATATFVQTKNPSCSEMGENTYTAVFQETWIETQTRVEANVPMTEHQWVEDYIWETDNSACKALRACSACDAEETDMALAIPQVNNPTCLEPGSTVYTATFTKDWAEPQTKTVPIDATGHAPSSEVSENVVPATCTESGSYDSVVYCATCGAELSRETITVDPLDHDWTVSYTWSDDGKSCTATRACGNDADHNMTETVTAAAAVKTPATCTEKGWNTYTVTFTADWVPEEDKVRTNDVQDIEALDHAWTVSYTWSDDGKSCTATRACGNDAAHNQTETITGTPTEKTPATCTEKGWNTYTVTFTEDWVPEEDKVRTNDVQDIPATDHSWVLTEYVWSDDGKTCTAHAKCQNANCEETTTAEGTITSGEKTGATCTEMGWTTYTAEFAVAWAETQTKDVQDITELGHDYVLIMDPSWAENGSTCTAYGRCSRCPERTSASADITSEMKEPATCTADGWTTYTATFTEDWVPEEKRVQTKDVQNIKSDGHAWSDPVYAWAEDGSGCTVTRTCANSESCTETLTATITSAVKTDATCVTNGWTTYTATFEEDWAQTQTLDVEDITATGVHSYTVEVTRTPATCMATGLVTWKCATCERTEDEVLEIDTDNHTGNNTTGVGKTDPTCTDDGYTGDTVCECGKVVQSGAVDPAFGHKDADYNHICDNNCGRTDMGFCADAPYDDDHFCDYGSNHENGCRKVLEECEDEIADGDHKCDICGKDDVSDHTMKPAECLNPSTCAECGYETGEPLGHADENLDHVCDNECGIFQGVHEDTDFDHKCEYGCAERIGECKDAEDDKDHVCDYGCGTVWEGCSDALGDGDHDCDICGAEDLSACFDSPNDADHLCDDCGATLAECTDAENDGDHYCDICDADNITECFGGVPTCQNGAVCDECGLHYGAVDPENHVSDVTYPKDNKDGTHTYYRECCDAAMDTENHTYTDGLCMCGNVQRLSVSVMIGDEVMQSTQVTYGGTIDLARYGTPTREGYMFVGWALADGTPVTGKIQNVTADLEIHSVWIKNTDIYYVITWVVDGMTIMQEISYTTIPVYGFGEDPVKDCTNRTHYLFAGWSLTENGAVLDSLPAVSADATYYAVFTEGAHADSETPDHKCDVCGYVMSTCSDVLTDDDHDCDICGKKLSSCADVESRDHKCDICNTVMTECLDEDLDFVCDWCGAELEKTYIRGDVDDDGDVDSDDAIYLLYYTFQQDEYPINQPGDMDGDGDVDSDDAIYLLYYTFQPNEYPLAP